MRIHLPTNTKTHCLSFGLPAGGTCPGWINRANQSDATSNKLAICKACYAQSGNYARPSIKTPRSGNELALLQATTDAEKQKEFIAIFKHELGNSRYFRWLDSGDVVSIGFAKLILKIARTMPEVKFWLPTNNYKIFNGLRIPANLSIRPSALFFGDKAPMIPGFAAGSTAFRSCDKIPAKHYVCPGSCKGCRVCWEDKALPVAYKFHAGICTILQLKKEGFKL